MLSFLFITRYFLATSCTQKNSCKGLCHKTPLGGVCGCREGYRLAADMVSCEDINECERDVCSQICRNTVGSFECSCYDGYVIRSDRVSCKIIGKKSRLNFCTCHLSNEYSMTTV